MRIRHMLVGAAVAATALGAFVTPASAARTPKPTSAKVVGVVRIGDDGTATVTARYRCTVADPENDPSELWVSVKQNDAGTVDREVAGEGSGFGGVAARWEDSHRNPVTCDGKLHVDTFIVDQLEDKSSYGTLVPGRAWVQFCLFDDTTPKGDGENDFGEPVSSMVWRQVV
jgi:hypothetical protein